MTRWLASLAVALGAAASVWLFAAEPATDAQMQARADQLFADGNFKDAYELFHKLALQADTPPAVAAHAVGQGTSSLAQLGRIDELDPFVEAAVAAHPNAWEVLHRAASAYLATEHYGTIISGKFSRGQRRGGGRNVSVLDRDRVRALQLFDQARPLVVAAGKSAPAARFWLDFARAVLQGTGNREAWQLQSLTDLTELPDYEDFRGGWWGRGGSDRGAPVDTEGNPVYHTLPESWDAAVSDGQRWRWLLAESKQADAAVADEADSDWAGFLQSQFGVQTMRQFIGASADDDGDQEQAGPFAVHTLADTETIARLATGVKRFTLPDEFNPLLQFRDLAKRSKSPYAEQASMTVAGIYEDRRQYDKAAEAWRESARLFGEEEHRKQRLQQIVGLWGRFESTVTQPTGQGAELQFRFRNAKKVTFTAQPVRIDALLADVKAYLAGSPREIEWDRFNIGDVGHRLITGDQAKYLGPQVANWSLDLEPAPKHWNKLATVATPLQKAGAYFVTATVDGGNTSRIVVWVADTALVKKPLDGQTLLYTADAVTGVPLARVNVECFGWKQEQLRRNQPAFRIVTKNFAEFSSADGLVQLDGKRLDPLYQWMFVARGEGGRLAYLGFTGVWHGRLHDEVYNQTKVFAMTDRPVYRPDQKVQFKLWVGQAKYDAPDASPFAGKSFALEIHDPQGEKVFEQTLNADEWGGIAGDFPLSKSAKLGQYQILIKNLGGGSFRVEEYKKPEFEVTVDAPAKPVALGEKITATIDAKYYFGGPVTKARVKYKVTRSAHTSRWFPVGRWDWFYGPGYWWFAPDYAWLPGWSSWGCARPTPSWWNWNAAPPELIAEQEVDIGPDGTVKVEIDTLPAKELHGDEDHSYSITAEVVDESRRTIVGMGNVLVARKPFKVYAWVDRGHYRVGDTVHASFSAFTLDQKPVQGTGRLELRQITYADGKPVEAVVKTWDLNTDVEGHAEQQLAASAAGQYRLSYTLTDSEQHTIEGGYVFVVRGEGFDGREFRFNDLELVTDQREYAPGDTVKLMISANRPDSAVVLFVRAVNGVCLPPKVIRLKGKSTIEEIGVVQQDMPNFFIEAFTVADGRYHQEVREVIVPPETRILDVNVEASKLEYKPGEEAKLQVKLTDSQGKPFVGSTVLTVYDRSLEYISGGANVPDIRKFFWEWRRHHHPQHESSLDRASYNLLKPNETGMADIGIFGGLDDLKTAFTALGATPQGLRRAMGRGGMGGAMPAAAPMAEGSAPNLLFSFDAGGALAKSEHAPLFSIDPPVEDLVAQPTIRQNFADTAFWASSLTTNAAGLAEVSFKMPENLTGWKIRTWSLGRGCRVGEASADVTTKKNLLLRLQSPRFFVETDEVVLSANIHNDLASAKSIKAVLELEGGTLEPLGDPSQTFELEAHGQKRIDWRVKVTGEGQAVVRMQALTDEESDAMQMNFPVYVHGMLKTQSFSGALRPDENAGKIAFTVPAERRPDQSRVEARFSPTLAGAMVDALPYLAGYPYGCTEQTLNRFLPTVITQKILLDMQLDLKTIRDKRTNLNAQQLGDPAQRAKQWQRYEHNPVFDEAEVQGMVREGLDRLVAMQVSDGGWGWFSGYGERSWPHTTAVVVHGLQLAQQNDVALVPGVLERGLDWLKNYQAEQVTRLKNSPAKKSPSKTHADALDALIYGILIDADVASEEMRQFLYRDRTHLPASAKALFGLALQKQGKAEELAMILQNLQQFLVEDNENQTAYLKLPEDGWWHWYGNDIEANAVYLKLLTRMNPQDPRCAKLVKYLLNNRRHATYWNSTRDTAYCIEALAEFLKASGEARPDLTIEIWLDGQKQNEVKVDAANLFTFDNTFTLTGDVLTAGEHTIEFRKQGTGPLYFNAYQTDFTLEDFITRAGLEIKVNRKYYKLTPVKAIAEVSGAKGQVVQQAVSKFDREELANLAELKSGDLVEVELEIDSKNDYEYLVFEDLKAAGFEPMEVRSGYNGNDMGAYIELRDERVCFFVRSLPRGKHSVTYRLRAEIPGKFSALPARGTAMYAPELKANSDEIKLQIAD